MGRVVLVGQLEEALAEARLVQAELESHRISVCIPMEQGNSPDA
jgi:hypothetical protein